MKIDTDRMTNGKEVAKKLRRERSGGIPWMVILDAEGKELVSSDGPGGNVGCPVRSNERAYFLEMLEKTAVRLEKDELATVAKALEAFAQKILAPRG